MEKSHKSFPFSFAQLVSRQQQNVRLLLEHVARLPPLPRFDRDNFDAATEAACSDSLELVLSATFHNMIDVRTRVDFKKG